MSRCRLVSVPLVLVGVGRAGALEVIENKGCWFNLPKRCRCLVLVVSVPRNPLKYIGVGWCPCTPHTPLRVGPFRKGLPLKALSLTGMAFAVEHLPDLIDVLQRARAHAQANGLLGDTPPAQAAE